MSGDSREKARREDARHIISLAGIAGILVAILVLAGAIDADAGLAGTAIGLVCLIVLALLALPSDDVWKHLDRVKSVTLGSLGIELADYESRAGDATVDADEESDKEIDVGKPLLDLRLGLEGKLTYLAKHVLGDFEGTDDPQPTFLTIGSLKIDRLLDEEQARVAANILTVREYEFRRLPASEQKIFLDGAKDFVKTVRIEIFARYLAQLLEERGWNVVPAPPRRDLLVQSPSPDDGTQHHVIPVFASPGSSLLDPGRKRLRDKPRAQCGGRCFLVVPPPSVKQKTDSNGIATLTPAQLLDELGPPPQPDGGS